MPASAPRNPASRSHSIAWQRSVAPSKVHPHVGRGKVPSRCHVAAVLSGSCRPTTFSSTGAICEQRCSSKSRALSRRSSALRKSTSSRSMKTRGRVRWPNAGASLRPSYTRRTRGWTWRRTCKSTSRGTTSVGPSQTRVVPPTAGGSTAVSRVRSVRCVFQAFAVEVSQTDRLNRRCGRTQNATA